MPPLLPSSGGAPLAVACSKRDHHMIANRRLPSIVSKPDRTAQRNSNRCLTSMNSGARWSAAIKTKVIKMASRGVNKVILIGNLGQDPEVRYTPGGKAVANITVATSETWKDQQGQLQERTEWHRCTMYARLAEIAGEYLKKGSKVYLEGRLQTREWQDQQGVKRYTTEIIVGEMQMLDGRPAGGRPPAQANTSAAPSPEANGRTTSEPPPMDFDDDLPFGYIGISGRALLLSM